MSRARELVETGVEWLDRVPSEWAVVPISRECWVRARLGWKGLKAEEYVDEGGYPMLSTPDIKGPDIDFQSAARITEARFVESPEIMLHVGDVLLTKDGSTIGTANIVRNLPEPTTLNGSIALLSPSRNLDGRYLYYVIESQYAQAVFDRLRGGAGVPHLFQRDINRIRIPLPPLEEQRIIGDYLDHETVQIDALVAKQEEFIGLLRERRSGLLFRAVTRGLYPDVPLQPSTLSWTAELPASWRVMNIRRVAAMKTGHTPSRSTPEYWEDTTIPWFTLADVWQLRDGMRTYLGETKGLISPLGLKNSAAELLPAGTVVLSRTASVGFSGIMPRPMATSQDFWNWVCGPDLVPEYLLQVFRAMRNEFNVMMTGSTHKTIYQPTAAAIRIPVPPVEEQRSIVEFINEQTTRIDSLIAKAEEHIALAKERRSALITAAVTGQIDVRTAQKAA